ncbi:hypothetical protein TYRP_014359 [Tyrophagus putrescentiae]|nr:hypothetical protein TYRP_014359 [Tyrophagus putrescentiae]
MSANVFAQHSYCTCIPQQCTAQGGEVWHHLATVNFRCLGSCASEQGPRRRKFTVAKRCRCTAKTCELWPSRVGRIAKLCTAQGGEVWHLLATLNFRCLEFCKQSEPTYKHFLTQKYAAKSTFDIDSAVNDDNRSSNNNSSVALHLQSSPATTTTSTIAVTQQHLTLASPTAQQ